MYKFLAFLIICCFTSNAQPKKSAPKGKEIKQNTVADSVKPVQVDTTDLKEAELNQKRAFGVYTRPKTRPKDRVKLCIHLVSEKSITNICLNDSICKNPEVSKILFEQKDGDSTYVLVLVDAFSKPDDKPACDAGKETKLIFVRWNTETNKAIWKQKNVSSCMRAITNMTKDPIEKWDKSGPLIVNYHKGGNNFVELKFDPQQYKLGLQSSSDN